MCVQMEGTKAGKSEPSFLLNEASMSRETNWSLICSFSPLDLNEIERTQSGRRVVRATTFKWGTDKFFVKTAPRQCPVVLFVKID